MSFKNWDVEKNDDKYLKIGAGESVQFHILSESPTKTLNHWIEKKKTQCEGKVCDYCAQGDKPKKGWNIKVWDRKDLKVKEYEFGNQVAAQIKNIVDILTENQQTVEDIDFRIKREGATLVDTEYFVNQVPAKEPVPAEAKKEGEVPF